MVRMTKQKELFENILKVKVQNLEFVESNTRIDSKISPKNTDTVKIGSADSNRSKAMKARLSNVEN